MQLSTAVPTVQHAAKEQKQPTQRNASEVQSPADAADELWADDSPPEARLSTKVTEKRRKACGCALYTCCNVSPQVHFPPSKRSHKPSSSPLPSCCMSAIGWYCCSLRLSHHIGCIMSNTHHLKACVLP